MTTLPLQLDETSRLKELFRYAILDSAPEASFDRLTTLAAGFLNVPVSLISLVDQDRIWFKSHHGINLDAVTRVPGLCPEVIKSEEVYVVENAETDPRTCQNPLVTGDFGLRFYAAAPLRTPNGYHLGTFNIIDFKPRKLTAQEATFLKVMAAVVMDELELRRRVLQADEESGELAKLALQIPGVIYQYKLYPDGRSCFPYASKGLREIYGVEPEEVREDASAILEALHPEDRDRVKASIQTSAQSLIPWKGEYRVRHRDGTEHWLSGNSQPESQADGSILWHGYLKDITEQKKAEEKETEALEFIRTVADNLPALAGYWTKNLTCSFANKGYEEWFGRTPGEVIGMKLEDLLGPELYALRKHYIEAVLAGEPQTFEAPLRKTHGEVRQTLTQYVPDKVLDRVRGFFVLISDITQVKETEQALLASEQQFAKAFEYASVGMALVNLDTRIMRANPALCTLLGYTEEEMFGKRIQDITYPEDLEPNLVKFHDLLEGKVQSYTMEKRFFHKSGRIIWGFLSASLVRDKEGKPVHLISQVQDITARKIAEEKEAEANHFIRLVTDNLPGLTAYWTKDLRCSFANQAYVEWYGIKPEEAVGMSIQDLLGPEMFKLKEPYIRGVLAGQPQTFETTMTKSCGQTCQALTQYVPDKAGDEVKGFFVLVSDITRVKETERALRASERQFANAFEYASVGMVLVGLDGRVLKINRALCTILGYTEEEMLLKSAQEMTHPEDLFADLEKREELLNGTISSYAIEKRYLHKSGHPVWTQLNVSLVRDSENQPVHFISQVQDITARKLAAEKEAESNRFITTVTDNMPGLIAYWSKDFRCSFANQNHFDWFGRQPEEMLGMELKDLIGEKYFQFRLPHLQAVLAGEPQSFEAVLTKQNGETCPVLTQYVPDKKNGVVAGFFAFVSDLTQHKILEDQLRQAQKLEVVGRLAGGVAHDFNNLLTAMLLNLEELEEKEKNPEENQPLRHVTTLARQGARLTQQLLTFARQQAMQTRAIEINDLLAQLLLMLERLIGEDITVTLERGGTDFWVEADSAMLSQAIINLCLNARDAMPQGGTLTLVTSRAELKEGTVQRNTMNHPGDFICIQVTDTGCGMDQETLKHVFEPFFTTKELGKGTGLGLASAYGTIIQHKGWMEVESVLNQGTTFRIYLPRSEKAALPQSSTGHLRLQAEGGKETILLVEDHPLVREGTTKILEILGYRVFTAGDGPEAIKVWETHSREIDLLFTDMTMPGGMSGLQLGEKLRKEKPSLGVVLTTGYSDETINNQVLQLSGAIFLAKPYQSTDLAGALRQCLKRIPREKVDVSG